MGTSAKSTMIHLYLTIAPAGHNSPFVSTTQYGCKVDDDVMRRLGVIGSPLPLHVLIPLSRVQWQCGVCA